MLEDKRILLIISGGIAAYKALDLIRQLRKRGAWVTPVLTKSATEFVTPLSVSALAEERAFQDLFDLTDEAEMGHIQLSRSADLIVVAPATGNPMAKMAHGMADELEAVLVHIAQGAEGFVGAFVLGAGIHQRALCAGEGQLLGVAFEQVLTDFRANAFVQITNVPEDRVVAPHRMARLQQIADADQAEHAAEQGERPQPFMAKEG